MTSNNTSAVCLQPKLFFTVGNYLNFVQYYIFLPIYCTIGFIGHIVVTYAFLHQAKTEKAYVYQIFLEIGQIVDVIAFATLLLTFLGAGIERDGYDWFLKIYPFMWYTAHLAIPLDTGSEILMLVLSVCMSADRCFALMKPFVYKDVNHKKHQYVALIICIFLSFGSTIYNVLLFQVKNDVGDKYRIDLNVAFVRGTVSIVLSQVCNAVRMIGLVALVFCNVYVLKAYRKIGNQKSKITQASSSNEKELKEKAKERLLILLTISQSFFMSILMLSNVTFYTAVYAVPSFHQCDHAFYGPLLNVVVMLCDLGSTLAVMALNPKARAMLFKALSILKRLKNRGIEHNNITAMTK